MANKITLQFDAKGHPAVQAAVRNLNKEVRKLGIANQYLLSKTVPLTAAQKQQAKGLLGLQNGLRNVGKQAGTTGATFSVLRSKMLLASFAYTILAASVIKFAKMYGEQQEIMNKAEVVFGSAIDLVNEWSKAVADATGANITELTQFASAVQDILVPMGMMRISAAEMSTEVVQLALDVASFNNAQDTDVLRDFNSAIVGNHETVRKYGIVISEARMENVALEAGIIKFGQTLNDQQKIQARILLLQKDSKDAVGDLAKTYWSFNNRQKALKKSFKDFGESVGKFFVPIVYALTEVMNVLLQLFSRPSVIAVMTWHLMAFAKATIYAKLGVTSLAGAFKAARAATIKFRIALAAAIKWLLVIEAIGYVLGKIFGDSGERRNINEDLKSMGRNIDRISNAAEDLSLGELKEDLVKLKKEEKILTEFTGKLNGISKAYADAGHLTAGIDVYGKSMANTVDSWVKHMSTLEASLERIEGGNWEIDFGTIDSLDPYQLGLSTLREFNIVIKENGRIVAESENGWENIIQIFETAEEGIFQLARKYEDLLNLDGKKFAKAQKEMIEEVYGLEVAMSTLTQDKLDINIAFITHGLDKVIQASDGTYIAAKGWQNLGDEWNKQIAQNSLLQEASFKKFGISYDDMIYHFDELISAAEQSGDSLQKLNNEAKKAEYIAAMDDYMTKINMKKVYDLNQGLKIQRTILEETDPLQKIILEHRAKGIELYEQEALHILMQREEIEKLEEAQDRLLETNKWIEKQELMISETEMLTKQTAAWLDMDKATRGTLSDHIEKERWLFKVKSENLNLTEEEIKGYYKLHQEKKKAEDLIKTYEQSRDFADAEAENLNRQIMLLGATTAGQKAMVNAKLEGLEITQAEIDLLDELEAKLKLVTDAKKSKDAADAYKLESAALADANSALEDNLYFTSMNSQELKDYIEKEKYFADIKAKTSDLTDDMIQTMYDEVLLREELIEKINDMAEAEQELAAIRQDYDAGIEDIEHQIAIMEEQIFLERELTDAELYRMEVMKNIGDLSEEEIQHMEELLDYLDSLNAEWEEATTEVEDHTAAILELNDEITNLQDKLDGVAKTPMEKFKINIMGEPGEGKGHKGEGAMPMFNALEQFAKDTKKYNQDILKSFADRHKANNEMVISETFTLKDQLEVKKEIMQEELEFMEENAEAQQAVRQQAADMAMETLNMFISSQRDKLKEQMNNELDALKKSEKYKHASDRKKESMEEDVKKKYADDQKRLFRMEQLQSVGKIAMNTAMGIMNAVSAFWWTGGMPWAAIIGAMGAAQIAMVLSQKPPEYAAGGLIGGKPHSQGGTIIEAERGEYMINRTAADAIGLEQLNAMNRTGSVGNNINVTLTGNVLSDDFVADEFIPKLEERLRVLADGTVSDRFA